MTTFFGDGAPDGAGGDFQPADGLRETRTRRSVDQRRVLRSIGEVVYEWDCISDVLAWAPGAQDALGALGAHAGALAATGKAWRAQLGADCAPPWLREPPASFCDGRYQVRYALNPQAPVEDIIWIEDNGRWFPGADGKPARAHGTARLAAGRRHAPVASAAPAASVLARSEFDAHAALLMQGAGAFACVLIAPALVSDAHAQRARDVADELMTGLAARVRTRMRRGDVIARFNEGAIGLLLEACNADQARIAVARFADAVMLAPIETSAGPLHARMQAGACIGMGGGAVEDLFDTALAALDHARMDPVRAQLVVRENRPGSMAGAAARRVSDAIRDALHERRVMIALQPIADAATGKPAFWEALVRVKRQDGTILNPAEFMPAIEETGLVAEIDQRMLELSLNVLEAEPMRRVCVNVSGATLHDPAWVSRIEATLAGRMRCAERLTFEITETSAIRDIGATGRDIARLHALGSRVAMDDFGAGHTSFRNLRALDIDVVKIDGAFIQGLLHSPDDQMFVRTLHGLARHLGATSVAEWVECAETARLLASWGVDYLQGAHFGLAEIWTQRPSRRKSAA